MINTKESRAGAMACVQAMEDYAQFFYADCF